jgi:hypothetical protein
MQPVSSQPGRTKGISHLRTSQQGRATRKRKRVILLNTERTAKCCGAGNGFRRFVQPGRTSYKAACSPRPRPSEEAVAVVKRPQAQVSLPRIRPKRPQDTPAITYDSARISCENRGSDRRSRARSGPPCSQPIRKAMQSQRLARSRTDRRGCALTADRVVATVITAACSSNLDGNPTWTKQRPSSLVSSWPRFLGCVP